LVDTPTRKTLGLGATAAAGVCLAPVFDLCPWEAAQPINDQVKTTKKSGIQIRLLTFCAIIFFS
jgi:hypothetical protein